MKRTATWAAAAMLLLPWLAAGQEAASVADTTDLADLTPAELFLRASSSALQFEAMREPSRRLLVRSHEESVPYLVTVLDTDDARERHALEDIFIRIGDPGVDPLIGALERETERTDTSRGARLAAGILGRIGEIRALGPLMAARTHLDWKVRAAVAGALGRIGVNDAAPGLTELVGDENEIVRQSAAVGLSRVAEAADEELGHGAIDALLGALEDPYYSVRYSAARALAAAGEPALAALEELAAEGGGTARILAVQALGQTGSGAAVRTLRDLLESEDWAVSAHAAEALGKIGLTGNDRKELERMIERGIHPFVAHKIELALEADRR